MSNNSGTMTNGQRIEALLNRRKPDRVPLWPFFDMTGYAAVYHNRPIQDAYKDPHTSLEMQRRVCQDFGWICSPFFPAFGVIDFGGERKLPSSEFSQAPSTVRYPIEKEEDVDTLTIPDLNKSPAIAREREFFRLCSQNRPDFQPFRAFVLLTPNPYEWAGRLCRPEMLNRWIIRKPELVQRILKITGAIITELLDYWYAELGADRVLVSSGGVICSNQIISPRQFEQFVLPSLKEYHRKTLDKGFQRIYCHVCGEQNLNLPHWQQVPMGDPGIISIGHEVDLEKAARFFPGHIIVGNMQPSILQTGSPEEVYNTAGRIIRQGKQLGGGFMFSTGCQFPPRAKLENVKAMNRAMDDFGRYS
ncbi:MAG: uroporphyrinogen decarboxylase family protein [Dehalococcoidales bacterium]|nr:uroporphyrinogen decarboxylase family protein [Dehalococcoidales bacterium]